jgi:hypothetical protein
MRPLRGRRLTVARGSPVTSSGIAATTMSPSRALACRRTSRMSPMRHACVAHGVAFHAVGEVVPVLEVEASLGQERSRSAAQRWEGQRRPQTPSGPRGRVAFGLSFPAYFHEVSGWVRRLDGNAKDGNRARLAHRPIDPSVNFDPFKVIVHRSNWESDELGELSNRWERGRSHPWHREAPRRSATASCLDPYLNVSGGTQRSRTVERMFDDLSNFDSLSLRHFR